MYFNKKGGKPKSSIPVSSAISNNVTIFTRGSSTSAPDISPHRPSFLVSRAKRVSKAQLAELQRKAKRRQEELLQEVQFKVTATLPNQAMKAGYLISTHKHAQIIKRMGQPGTKACTSKE
ncbi:hypothetical protein FRC08_010021 [Ceratobasidium sp. 394]|nr:hypothetical protein FRC08_010021 [Ceratobasidium sp. 394]